MRYISHIQHFTLSWKTRKQIHQIRQFKITAMCSSHILFPTLKVGLLSSRTATVQSKMDLSSFSKVGRHNLFWLMGEVQGQIQEYSGAVTPTFRPRCESSNRGLFFEIPNSEEFLPSHCLLSAPPPSPSMLSNSDVLLLVFHCRGLPVWFYHLI